jgi:hypothetical protein
MATFPTSNEQRPSAVIEIDFGERERFLDPQSRTPENHDQTAQAAAVRTVAGGAHDSDDLLNLRRIGRVAQTLVAWWATGVEARHCGRRPLAASSVEQQLGHDPSRDSLKRVPSIELGAASAGGASPSKGVATALGTEQHRRDPALRALSDLPRCDSGRGPLGCFGSVPVLVRSESERRLGRADIEYCFRR